MSSIKDELLAKKARLAELKRQRALREEQDTSGRHSIGEVRLLVHIKTTAWKTHSTDHNSL